MLVNRVFVYVFFVGKMNDSRGPPPIMVVATQGDAALTILKCAAVLPMFSHPAPPSACVSDGDCVPWVSDELVKDVCGHFLSLIFVDTGAHSLDDGSRIRISLTANDEMVHARVLFSPNEGERLMVTGQFLWRTIRVSGSV